MKIGQVLKRLREEQGLSQSQVARLLGVDRAYINLLEKDRRGPSADTVRRLAEIFNVSPQVFYERSERALPSRSFNQIWEELEVLRPVAIPIVAEGSAGNGMEPVDYAYWARPKVAGRNIVGIQVSGDCLEPELSHGDVVFVDMDIAPEDGDLVLCTVDGKIAIKRYREVNGERWLENRYGRVEIESEADIKGVVIEKNIKVRRRKNLVLNWQI